MMKFDENDSRNKRTIEQKNCHCPSSLGNKIITDVCIPAKGVDSTIRLPGSSDADDQPVQKKDKLIVESLLDKLTKLTAQ